MKKYNFFLLTCDKIITFISYIDSKLNYLLFAVKYNDELASLNDRYMHLTNYSINRLSKNYTPNEDFAACEGHKW
jgi:hypothetical protein